MHLCKSSKPAEYEYLRGRAILNPNDEHFFPYNNLFQLDESFNFFFKSTKIGQSNSTKQNRQTKQTTIFLPKINKVFLLNDPFDELRKMIKQKDLYFQEDCQNSKL